MLSGLRSYGERYRDHADSQLNVGEPSPGSRENRRSVTARLHRGQIAAEAGGAPEIRETLAGFVGGRRA